MNGVAFNCIAQHTCLDTYLEGNLKS